MDKFCVNCRHYSNPNSLLDGGKWGPLAHLGKCVCFNSPDDKYLVTGVHDLVFCTTARFDESMCGKDGKRYESNIEAALDERR